MRIIIQKQIIRGDEDKRIFKGLLWDNVAKEVGHTILSLPAYHCIFNTIELMSPLR